MTKTDTVKIFAILKVNYSNFFKNLTEIEAKAMVELWAEMFADEPAQLVSAAVKSYIATDISGYPPNVGAIKENVRKLTAPKAMAEIEAINIIRHAAANSLYDADAEFEKLPQILKRLTGNSTRLREWGLMDSDTFNSVVASNVMRSYKTILKEEREYQVLPKDVKQALSEFQVKEEKLIES